MEEADANLDVASVNSEVIPKTLWIEGRVRDGVTCEGKDKMQNRLKEALSNSYLSFEISEDILSQPQKVRNVLGPAYDEVLKVVSTLRIVEYAGPKTDYSGVTLHDSCLKIQLYEVYDEVRSFGRLQDLPQAEITPIPHVRFEGKWDELVFDCDLKEKLIRMIWNMTHLSAKGESTMNPLCLLYGPPGTGKTSLCQALAQKISIRLSSKYQETKLVEIRTASLLSKYFGQSAKHVEEIFCKIFELCAEDDERFICVLVDEVESIAASRERTALQGEAQDSLRATNALLTGIDRLKDYKNVILLCTSNFVGVLDAAFLDRCAFKQSISTPNERGQYKILRRSIQSLIDKKLMTSDHEIPSYDDAILDHYAEDLETPGAKLIAVLKYLQEGSAKSRLSWTITGRSLAQLPYTATMMYLQGEKCTFEDVLTFMRDFVKAEEQGLEPKDGFEDEAASNEVKDQSGMLEIRGKKRKFTIVMEEDFDELLFRNLFDYLNRQDMPDYALDGPGDETVEHIA